jgi:large subunit ribosomal protein L14
MIQPQTILKVADNSGILTVKCIKVLKKEKKAKIGSLIIVSVKKFKVNNVNKLINLRKKLVIKALVLTTKKSLNQKNGFFINFSNNSAICLDNQNNFLGNRISGIIPRKLKKKFNKLVGFSFHLI